MPSLPLLVQVAVGLCLGLLAADASGEALLLAAGGATVALLASLRAPMRGLRAAALALLLGLCASARARAPPLGDALAAGLTPSDVRLSLEGEVVEADPPSAEGLTLLADVHSWTTGEGRTTGRARVRLLVEALEGHLPPEVRPGDRVAASGTAALIPPASNPGAYDASEAWARREVHARVKVPDPRGIEVRRVSDSPLAGVAALRNASARALDRAFAPAEAGLLRSLLLGDRSVLSDADRRRFRDAGAAHILAISGAHVALLVAAVLALLRRARCPPRPAAAVVLVAVAFLVPFTGSASPVVRSAAGFALFLLGRLMGLEPSGGVLLAAVAGVFLVLDPAAGGDPGFRMSFAAAAGLVLLAGRLHRALVPERPALPGLLVRPRAPIRAAVAVCIAAWLGSAPFAVHDLGQTSWAAVPVGLVAVPLSTAVMLLGALAAAVQDVPALGGAALTVTTASIDGLRAFLDVPAHVGLATTHVVPPGGLWYALYLAAFAAAASPSKRPALAGGAGMLALLGALGSPTSHAPPEHVRLTLLDVGHGQAALLEAPGEDPALLDAGSRDRPDAGDRIVVPALKALGVTRLSLALASHADSDHFGALPSVLNAFPVARVAVPPAFPDDLAAGLEVSGEPPLRAVDGDVLLEGDWGRLVVLGPGTQVDPETSRNDGCLVLLLETPEGDVLLPGDRMDAGVHELLTAHPSLRCDVLVLPHHGHPALGRDRLVAATDPRVLLASAPRGIVPRLPPGTRCTGSEGAIVLDLLPEGPRVTTPWSRGADGRGACDAPSARGPPMDDLLPLLVAALVLVAIAFLAARLRWLTAPGAAGAALLGFVAVHAFGWAGLATLLAPFLAATLAGRLPGGPEGEGPRTLRQVAANGVPALLGIVFVATGRPALGAAAFAGALSALGADTLATEFGVRYGGTPRSLFGFARMEPGASGGVTLVGFLASVAGSLLAPAALLAFGVLPWNALPLLAAAGFAAGLFDSALGATLQRKGRCDVCHKTTEAATHCGAVPARLPGRLTFLDNDAVNLANGFLGAVLAAGLAG